MAEKDNTVGSDKRQAAIELPVDTEQKLSAVWQAEVGALNEGGLKLRGHYKNTTKDTPLVSIITATLNRREYIEQAIIYFQKYPEIDGLYGNLIRLCVNHIRHKRLFQVSYKQYLLSRKGTF